MDGLAELIKRAGDAVVLLRDAANCLGAKIDIDESGIERLDAAATDLEAAIDGRCKPTGGTMSAEVIHLAFTSPLVEADAMAFIACRACRNKTYTLTEDKVGDFPLMRCAACGCHIGRMGWAEKGQDFQKSESE